MTKTAVVILNYNGSQYLKKFLPSVLANSPGKQVIVADNNSSDDSLELLNREFPEVRLISFDENFGFAGGYNHCLQEVKAEYYLILNSDVEVTENWLAPLEDFLDQNTAYAAVQPKIKSYSERDKFEYAGAAGGFIDFLGYPYCRGRLFDHVEIDSGQYDTTTDIFWASGACMLIRSDWFHKAGGFDEDFFAHMEEIDLCWRLHSLDQKVACNPSSVVYHVGGGTLSKQSPFKTYLNFRNGLYLLLKNLPASKLILKFPARIILDWVAAVKFLLEGGGNHSWAVIKAHASVIIHLFKMIKKRTHTSVAPRSKLMIYQYFIRNRKTFSSNQ